MSKEEDFQRPRRKSISLVLTVVALLVRKPNTVSNGLTGIRSEKRKVKSE